MLDSEKQFSYAQHLYLKGDYSRAIDEFNRFVYFFPEDRQRLLAHYRIGMAYYHMKSFAQAAETFHRIIEDDAVLAGDLSDTVVDAWFMVSECYARLNRCNVAVIQMENLMALTTDPSITDLAHIRIAWIYIQSASWHNARLQLKSVRAATIDRYGLGELVRRLEAAEENPDTVIPRKKPYVAGLLSLIPGAGYVYCERYRDALISFIVNGGLILAACQAFDGDNPALGVMLSAVETGFYTGNIYGSVTAAHKYNRARQSDFIKSLKQRYAAGGLEIGLVPDFIHQGAMVAVRFRF